MKTFHTDPIKQVISEILIIETFKICVIKYFRLLFNKARFQRGNG